MRLNLVNERRKKQLTQAETAKVISVTTRQYINLEAGTSDGSIKVWQKLKNLFNKPIDFLLEQETTDTEPEGNQVEGVHPKHTTKHKKGQAKRSET